MGSQLSQILEKDSQVRFDNVSSCGIGNPVGLMETLYAFLILNSTEDWITGRTVVRQHLKQSFCNRSRTGRFIRFGDVYGITGIKLVIFSLWQEYDMPSGINCICLTWIDKISLIRKNPLYPTRTINRRRRSAGDAVIEIIKE